MVASRAAECAARRLARRRVLVGMVLAEVVVVALAGFEEPGDGDGQK